MVHARRHSAVWHTPADKHCSTISPSRTRRSVPHCCGIRAAFVVCTGTATCKRSFRTWNSRPSSMQQSPQGQDVGSRTTSAHARISARAPPFPFGFCCFYYIQNCPRNLSPAIVRGFALSRFTLALALSLSCQLRAPTSVTHQRSSLPAPPPRE
jgi:hypothetical protein